MEDSERQQMWEIGLDKSPRYQGLLDNHNDIQRRGIKSISKIAQNVKMFNMPKNQTYKKLENIWTTSGQSSVSKSRIKMLYSINGDRSSKYANVPISSWRLSDINKTWERKSKTKIQVRQDPHTQSQYINQLESSTKHNYVTKQDRQEGREKNRRRSNDIRSSLQRHAGGDINKNITFKVRIVDSNVSRSK
jgi:hypothetical protein